MPLKAGVAALREPLLLLFIMLPVANVIFRIRAIDEFTQGYRFMLLQHRHALHRTLLAQCVNPYNSWFRTRLPRSHTRCPLQGTRRRTHVRWLSSKSAGNGAAGQVHEFAGRLLFPDRHLDRRRNFRRLTNTDRLTVFIGPCSPN